VFYPTSTGLRQSAHEKHGSPGIIPDEEYERPVGAEYREYHGQARRSGCGHQIHGYRCGCVALLVHVHIGLVSTFMPDTTGLMPAYFSPELTCQQAKNDHHYQGG
jgi:hypothetical protein